MRRLAVLISLATLALPAPASAGSDMLNMQFVARVPYASSSHLELMVRDVGGVPHTYAFLGSRGGTGVGLRIIDVTNPESPVLVGHVPCAQSPNDTPIASDGSISIVGDDSGGPCQAPAPAPRYQQAVNDYGVVDLTDLSNPRLLGTPLPTANLKGIHTAVFHPSQKLAYLANQELPSAAPTMWIADFRSPPGGSAVQLTSYALPRLGVGPHDITFKPDGTRAYVSSIDATHVLDTTNPTAPVLISTIVDATINIHHEAFVTPNGRYLVIIDEQAGGIGNGTCPGGGVHVYDMAVEQAPVPVGVFFANDTRPLPGVCTAHEGNFSADGTRLTLGWYNGGVRVFDTSVLTADNPPGAPVGFLVTEVAHAVPGSAFWSAKTHPNLPGYVFASNMSAGFEVYRLTA